MSPARRRALLLFAFAVALGLRLLPIPRVFTVAYVNFQGDSWYHMRRVDALLADSAQTIAPDPYVNDQFIPVAPLLDWLSASVIRVLGSSHADAIAACLPPFLGALVVFPVFGLGRAAYGERPGLWAAFASGLLPGTFLQRSSVGYHDHHVLEVLTTTLAAWALVRAQGESLRERAGWAALSGVCLACYNLSWSGAPFFAGAIILWFVLDSVLRFARGGLSLAPLPWTFALSTFIAWAGVVLLQTPGMPRRSMQIAALLSACAVALAVWLLSAAASRARNPRAIALGIATILIAASGVLFVRTPALRAVVDQSLTIASGGGSFAVGETRPLWSLIPGRPVETLVLFSGTGLVALVGWPIALRRLILTPNSAGAFVVSFAALAAAATLGQNRFAYYLAVPLALLSGFVMSAIAVRVRAPWKVALLTVLFFAPNLVIARRWLSVEEGMPVGWHQALSWLRRNAPAPFEQATAYELPGTARGSEARHRVLAWWDFGYWIVRVGRQVPIANPTQDGADVAARLLTAPINPQTVVDLANARVRYVALGEEIPYARTPDPAVLRGMFGWMLDFAKERPDRFAERLYERRSGALVPLWVFKAPYFESLAIRLHLFDGSRTRAENISVFLVGRERAASGRTIRVVREARQFGSYEDARTYYDSLPVDEAVLGSTDPLRSCVDLPSLEGFVLRYESTDRDTFSFSRPRAKVFEFLPFRGSGVLP